MRAMSIRELRDSLADIDDILSRDPEVTVTRHGRPVARLMSLENPRELPSHADLRASTPLMAVGSQELVREDRERG